MGFPCDGRKWQHQQGWKELESMWVRVWGACVLTRVCGSTRGARGCCIWRWEFLWCHPQCHLCPWSHRPCLPRHSPWLSLPRGALGTAGRAVLGRGYREPLNRS